MVCQRDPWLDLDCFELQRVSGDCEGMKKVSHVTVSGDGGKRCKGLRETMSHVRVAGCIARRYCNANAKQSKAMQNEAMQSNANQSNAHSNATNRYM